jgi:hypothetical protein
MKVLVCGDIDGEIDLLFKRINTLQASAHGPFDILFCCGRIFIDEDNFNSFLLNSEGFPIPTYAFGNIFHLNISFIYYFLFIYLLFNIIFI